MKKLRRITAVILAMVMVLSTMTNVFAAPKTNKQKYKNVSLNINTSDNSKFKFNGIWCSFDDGKNWKELEKSIFDGAYRAWGDWSRKTFDTNTIFKVEVQLANGEVTSKIINDVANYNNTGKWYYQACIHEGVMENGLVFDITFDVECNVTYNVDGDKDTDKAVKGKSYTIKSELPTKDGYTFAGWLYNGKTYKPGKKINKVNSNNIELIAQWDAIEYSVSYDANEGNGAPTDSAAYIIGNNVVVSDVVPTKDKAVFKGWSYNGEVYTAGEEVEIGASDVVFTAVWNPIYRISYVVDEVEVGFKEVEAGTDVSELLTYEYTELDESKNLSAWSLETDANVKAIDKDIVVSATTSTKTFTVIYNLNGEEYKKIENVPYGKSLELLGSPAKESENFSTWKVESGDITNITSDVVISGSTSVKKFTVTYKVDGVVLETYENVEYGADLPVYEYTVKEGYDFTGWGVMPSTVQKDLVFEGTTTIKKFVVTFKYDNGQEDLSVEYSYGDQVTTPANPKKNDVKFENGTDAASWSKFKFVKWVAEGDYTTDNLNSVTQNMTFKATYKETPVKVLFFVLNRGVAQKAEPGSHSSSDYSNSVAGSLKSFTAVANNDEKVAQMIHTAPSAEDFGIELKEGETIKWYVVKKVNDEKWHIDGIIVGQKYDLVINYVDAETNEPIMESTVTSVAATNEYNVDLPEIEGYELVENTTVSGVMPYDNVETTVKYQKKTFTVTYKVDGEVVEELTAEYGDEVPTYEYEVVEGYEFSGFELVTEVEDATVVKQNMVFEGTTSEIVEEEEDIELDTPFAPGTGSNDNNDVDTEEEEDITLDTPFASGTKGTANNNDVDAEEEEDIDLATPFASGAKTGDESNYTVYVAVLLIAAVGAMVVAYNKKRALN